jgi:hypothetical protein
LASGVASLGGDSLCKDCLSYVEANRIAKRVFKMGGSNDFLAVKGSTSVGVRDDFQQTKDGLRRKDTLVFASPPASSTWFFLLFHLSFFHHIINIYLSYMVARF